MDKALAGQHEHAVFMAALATKRLHTAKGERDKLLKAHYSGAVPLDLLTTEMGRLTREISTAEQELAAATTSVEDIANQLERALALVGRCAEGYRVATPAIRRLMNQGFFAKIYIAWGGGVERVDLTPPFAAILNEQPPTTVQTVPEVRPASIPTQTTPGDHPATRERLGGPGDTDRTRPVAILRTILNHKTPGQDVLTRGVKMITLAEAEGFEPPDP